MFTEGLGLTSTVEVCGVTQLPTEAVVLNVTVTGALVVLVNVPEIVAPLPLAGIPVTATVLSLVQLKEAAPLVLVVTILLMASPLQMVCEEGDIPVTPPSNTVNVAFALKAHPYGSVMSYVSVCVPAAGSNTPAVTPVPEKLPPAGVAVNVTGAVEHTSADAKLIGFAPHTIVIV